MKKFLMVVLSFILVGCGSIERNELLSNYKELNKKEEESIIGSYVGSYYKDSMGGIYGGHLINLYNDNTVKIYYAFYNWMMGGNSFDTYEGTYSLINNELTIDYEAEGDNYTFNSSIIDNSFRGEILINMNFPDDNSNNEVSGITYYEVEATAITYSGEVFIGTTVTSDGYLAQILQLNYDDSKTNGEFVLTSSNKYLNGKIEGTYSLNKECSFTYNIFAVSEGSISDIVLKNDHIDSFDIKGDCVINANFNIGYLTNNYSVNLLKMK